jgi:hypothetical protein
LVLDDEKNERWEGVGKTGRGGGACEKGAKGGGSGEKGELERKKSDRVS